MPSSDDRTDAGRVEQASPQQEHKFHDYTGRRIPWYIRVIWIGFWIFAIYYVATYLLTSLQVEIVNPP